MLTCQDDGTTTWDDDRLLDRATQLGRVLFSQDDDLLAIVHQWQRSNRSFAGLVYEGRMGLPIMLVIRHRRCLSRTAAHSACSAVRGGMIGSSP